MKKILFAFLLSLGVTSLTFANSADVFKYDANKVNEEMTQLQSLEDFVAVNPGVTLSNLQEQDNSLINGLNLATGSFNGVGSLSGEPALGIPSFLWGCVLNWVGILIVYLVTDDSAETKKALMGCIVSAVGWAIFWVIYYVVLAAYWWY